MAGMLLSFPVVLLVLLHRINYVVNAADAMEQDCRGIKLEASEEQLLHMKACLKEGGVEHLKDLPTGKLPCFGKCVFVKSGLIDAKGAFVKEKMFQFIAEEMPKSVHEGLKKGVDECLSQENIADVDKNDETCASYLPALMCIHMAILEECSKE